MATNEQAGVAVVGTELLVRVGGEVVHIGLAPLDQRRLALCLLRAADAQEGRESSTELAFLADLLPTEGRA